jgi:CRISPR-associated endonuclease/helicase Cas3
MSGNIPQLMAGDSAIAHLAEDGRAHSLEEHLRRVGKLASEFAAPWGATEHAKLAGELHDLGKYAADFQAYIRSAQRSDVDRLAAHIEDPDDVGLKRRVDHSTAGALQANVAAGPVGALLAFVIAGHHAGLANRSALKERLAKPEKKQRLLDACAGAPPADLMAPRNLDPPFPTKNIGVGDAERTGRRLELWTRMLFSALCDADFLDTEEFFDRTQSSHRERARGWSLDRLLGRLTAYVDAKERSAPATDVNGVRREIRRAAIEAAALPPGVFTLTVPTGGGKTLAGMEFALRHAQAHGHKRVIVAIPYTSIIEQSADVYRAAFADDEAVLEHHSNFDPLRETPRSRLSAQNWDVPIIVTTTVQLFESLFARRTSACRKLHNLARSVIVLDEAQAMPVHLLASTLEVLGDIVRDYGASLVISTATQPALGRTSLPRFGLDGIREIVPAEVHAVERLQRVRVHWPNSLTPIAHDLLAQEIATEQDVLAITHRRKDARELTEALDAHLDDTSTIHLSALMCADHRTSVLADIKRRKSAGEPVRVVSTQLVEAGVDLDFPVVYRALAGLDSMAQAAGRCNREGRLAAGQLRVFVPESRPPPGVLQAGLAITEGMLRAEPALPFLEGGHYRTYFERLYATADNDKKGIQPARAGLRFEDVADAYKMIEDDWSAPIIVRYGRANELLDDLLRYGPSRARHRALGRFSVNAPRRLVDGWIASGYAFRDEDSGVVALAPHVAAYDLRFGLVPERVLDATSPDTLIVDG